MINATDRVRMANLGIDIGIIIFHDIDLKGATSGLQSKMEWALDKASSRWLTIQENLNAYSQFFENWGYFFPLSAQIKDIRDKGLPRAPVLVQALLLCEAAGGVLMGVQDWDSVQGKLVLDLAESREGLTGFKGFIPCKEGEPVLRDDKGIIASYFQGPDWRTAIRRDSRSIAFLALGAPNMADPTLRRSLQDASEILAGAYTRYEGPVFMEGCRGIHP